ncbi:MAG: hypothetical protein WAM50_11150 [Pseudolabrys sp.]
MSAFGTKRIIRTNYRSGIDQAKIHKFVAANNKKRLAFDPIIHLCIGGASEMDNGVVAAGKLMMRV